MQGWALAKASTRVPEGAQSAVYRALNPEGRKQLVAELEEISEPLLREVIRAKAVEELVILARREELSDEQLVRVARGARKKVREALLRRDTLGPKTLAVIAAADDPVSSGAVFLHPNTPDEIRVKILAGESCKPRGRKRVPVPQRILDSYYLGTRTAYLAPVYAASPVLAQAVIAARFPQGLKPAAQLSWALRLVGEESGRYAGHLLQVASKLHAPLQDALGGLPSEYTRSAHERGEVTAQARRALEELAARAAAEPRVLEIDEPGEMRVEVKVVVDKASAMPRFDDPAVLIEAMRSQERGVRAWIAELTNDLPWEEIIDAQREESFHTALVSELCERPDVPAELLAVLIPTHPRLVAMTPGLTREHVHALLRSAGDHRLQGRVLASLRITAAELAQHALPARATFRYLESATQDPRWQERTAHELQSLVCAALGDDAGHWGTYVGLLEGFEGGLEELLEVVVLAS